MKAKEWQLDSFDWLPENQWNVDNLVGPYLGNQGYCKVCDDYVDRPDLDKHIKKHVRELIKLKNQRKFEANERRKENLRIAREERARIKEMERQSKEREYE